MIARLGLSLVILTDLVCLGQTHQLPLRLTSEERSAALETIKAQLIEKYVFPEVGPKIVEALTRSQRGGRYDVENPYVFAERITEDMRSAGHDHHLRLTADQTAYTAALELPKGDVGMGALERRRAIRHHYGQAS
jgi:hypothetical protein